MHRPPITEAFGTEAPRILPQPWIAVGAVEVEERPCAGLEANAVPLKSSFARPPVKGKKE